MYVTQNKVGKSRKHTSKIWRNFIGQIPFLIEFETFYIVGANSLNLVLATRAKTFYN